MRFEIIQNERFLFSPNDQMPCFSQLIRSVVFFVLFHQVLRKGAAGGVPVMFSYLVEILSHVFTGKTFT